MSGSGAGPDRPGVDVRPVEGRPGCFVGRDGSAWAEDESGRLVRLPIVLTVGGVARSGTRQAGQFNVGNAVLRAFVGPPPGGYVARRGPDPDPLNNCVENLKWRSRGRARICAAQAESPRAPLPPPPPPRFVGPLADLIEDDRKRARRLARSETPERYRAIQDEAFTRLARGRAAFRDQKRSWRARVAGGRDCEN